MSTAMRALGWAVGGIFGGLARALLGPVSRLLQSSLTQPYPLGPGAAEVWSFMRGIALAGLGALLLYGALRHMLGPVLGLPAAGPALLLARLVAAVAACSFSLTVVGWMLAANAEIVHGVVAAAGRGAGVSGLLAPIASIVGVTLQGVAVGALAPEVLAVACLAIGLWVAAAYYLRAAEILLLTALAPVAAVLWLVPEAEGVWRSLFGELVVSIFTQAAQVAVLWLAVAAGLLDPGGMLSRLLTTLGLLVLLARVRPLLQALAHGGRPQGAWGSVAPWRVARGVTAGTGAVLGRLARGAL